MEFLGYQSEQRFIGGLASRVSASEVDHVKLQPEKRRQEDENERS